MISKIKNIILFTVIAAALILGYVFFLKGSPEEDDLITVSSDYTVEENSQKIIQNSSIANDFLSVLLGVRSLKLDDSIFSDSAFANLKDSSILLSPPSANEQGRVNPFAPIGSDITQISSFRITQCDEGEILNETTNTCAPESD